MILFKPVSKVSNCSTGSGILALSSRFLVFIWREDVLQNLWVKGDWGETEVRNSEGTEVKNEAIAPVAERSARQQLIKCILIFQQCSLEISTSNRIFNTEKKSNSSFLYVALPGVFLEGRLI